MKMKKETTPLIKPITTFSKQNPIYFKLIFFFLLLGLTLFLFSSRSIDNSSPPLQIPTPFVATNQDLETKLSPEFDSQDTQTESESESLQVDQGSPSLSTPIESHQDEAKPKCDLFRGDWVPNPNGPSYSNRTCNLIESQQNCMTNGRPDSGYLYWRWKPSECELPKFNPETFLNLMRNKIFAFIGDSISRNHVQSMLCILSQVEEPKVTYYDAKFRSSSWVFPSYNFTLERLWAPFLLKADTFEDNNGNSASDIKLHLDKLEEVWTKNYTNYDYVIIAAGQWFLKTAIYHENNQAQGCHYCPGKNLTELGFDYAYRKAVNLVLNFITNSPHKPQVFYRTITPSHFENGEWHNGGTCKRVVPFKAGQVNATDADSIMYDVERQEFDKASRVASENGVILKLFDSTQLSLLRPDGHPGPYRDYQPFASGSNVKVQNDCLHWCLPGPIDTWNELVLEMVMNG